MTQYLISFGAHAMDHIPDEDAPAVARAAHAAVQEAINAGVYVSAGGLENQPASIVATDGAVTEGPYPEARSSTCPHARRRCSGLPRSPSPAAARKRSGRWGPTPNSTRCSARLIADGDVPAAPDRRRPAALRAGLALARPDKRGSTHRPEPGTRGSASWAGREARSSWLTGSSRPLIARWSEARPVAASACAHRQIQSVGRAVGLRE